MKSEIQNMDLNIVGIQLEYSLNSTLVNFSSAPVLFSFHFFVGLELVVAF